jgi:hypothetical protein
MIRRIRFPSPNHQHFALTQAFAVCPPGPERLDRVVKHAATLLREAGWQVDEELLRDRAQHDARYPALSVLRHRPL